MPNPDAVLRDPPAVLSPNLDVPTDVEPTAYYDDALADNTTELIGQFKKGYRTSEFWLTLLGVGVIAGSSELGVDLSTEQVVGIIGAVATYAGQRGWLKVNRVKALRRYF